MMQHLLSAVNTTARPRIVVVGDLILDRYIIGEVSRISPEAPIPVLAAEFEEYKLGGAANVAANIASMGGAVDLIGVLGADGGGKVFRGLVRAARAVTLHAATVSDRPTAIKTRMVARRQQMLRVDEERAAELPRAVSARLEKIARERLRGCALLIVSDYGKGVLGESFTRKLISLARAAKVPVVVDPKGRDYAKYAGATVLTPNRHEAELATGVACDTPGNIAKCARVLKATAKLAAAVITLGADGVAVLTADNRLERIPTIARAVFDVTGAGDTFIATLGTFMALGRNAGDAARLANIAAGVKVGRFGAAAITRDELRRALIAAHADFDHEAKIVSVADLTMICASLRAAGRRIVFTNGCFDILHAGHVTYLNFCKERGDVLILGLNSDGSVRKLKGSGRPVNGEGDRARVLAALADVDFVAVFDEPTPERVIRAVRPDVLVKGADWKGKTVAGAAFVKSSGGTVAFAPLLRGRSTSSTLKRIKSGPRS